MTRNYQAMATHNLSKALTSLGFVLSNTGRRCRLYRHEDGRTASLPVNEHSFLSPVLVRMLARDVGPQLDDYLKWID